MAVATTQSWQEHTSDGSTAYFSFNFNYDTTRPGTIVVGKRTADNTYSVVDASNYELIPNAAGDGGQIRFIQNPSGSQIIDDIPPAGTIIRIERVSVDTSSATWQIGLEMSELVNLFDRLFRLVQENKNNFANVIKTFETQHNISLYELLSEHDNHLLYWDNTTQTLTPTDFPKEDVVRATDGMFLRISTDTAGNPYLEWSLTGTDNWHSVSDTAVEALSKIDTHLADKNNPHETAVSKLTDVELTNLNAGQFIMFDGVRWKNTYSTTTTYWGGILGNIDDQTDLKNRLDSKVNTDGTSVMTAPLLMRATDDFKCAIAPYWDGIGFFKLNDNNSVTLMASIEYQGSFAPAENNVYNIGSTLNKWKNLYLTGKAYMSVINNGFDIAVPVTNSADTLALKSQVDDAANSGEQLYTTGVWYAKMYSASVVPTGAEYDGKNYADFSQVDNDNNPIVVIYEGQSGSWVEIARITPPANHVAYLTITSKIWDIAEQTDQQGGEILWSYNQKTFTPYPKIVNLLNQANTDLSNLTSTGKNISNWSSNVTNCITEIPQDIKLELDTATHTITLKAGSKVYVPNGFEVDGTTPHFDTITTTADLALAPSGSYTGQSSLYVKSDGSALVQQIDNKSGTTAPTGGAWYDTNTNLVKQYSGGSDTGNRLSLPVAVATRTSGNWTSIDQIFNGFGYMGSSGFTLPGVKGMIPNGRNTDGTLNNLAFEVSSVLVSVVENVDRINMYFTTDGTAMNNLSVSTMVYDSKTNYNYRTDTGAIIMRCPLGTWSKASGVIYNFNPKTVFRAVDYSEADYVIMSQKPTADNNYTWYRRYKSGWVEQGGVGGTGASTSPVVVTLPVTMADENYSIMATFNGSSYREQAISVIRTSTTQISLYHNTNSNYMFWEVKGFAA